MIKFFKSFYFTIRFFWMVVVVILFFLFSFWFNYLYVIGWILADLLLVFTFMDNLVLLKSKKPEVARKVPEKLSNSDVNPIQITLKNLAKMKLYLEIVDELPIQFQKRDFLKKASLNSGEKLSFEYTVRPVERGEYHFGRLHVFVSTSLKLVKIRRVYNENQTTKTYPSFIQMKKYAFLAIDGKRVQAGLKKIRRIGHTQEFEQIKQYVRGDDVRSINWKSTAKHSTLMVNQFQDEKAQPIYSIIDTGRVMKMPFNGLSLLDYAINSSLAFSNIALQKKDKVGLLSFSNKTGIDLPASSKKSQLNLILESLYNLKTEFLDSDFGMLYSWANRQIKQRSLLILYTNFEHMNGLNRKLKYLQALAKKNVVVVVFFENTELDAVIHSKPNTISEMAHQTIAEDFASEKRLMVKKLQQHGLQAVLTKPEELTVNTINKYLEIKARGLL